MAWQEGWIWQLTDFILACYQTNRAATGMSGDLNFATLYASIEAGVLDEAGADAGDLLAAVQ